MTLLLRPDQPRPIAPVRRRRCDLLALFRLAMLSIASLIYVAPALAAEQQLSLVPAASVAGLENLPIHIGGRVDRSHGGLRHEWPGVYFEARFRGSSLSLAFADTLNSYQLLVDDGLPIPLRTSSHAVLRVVGLTSGTHAVRLEKVTESNGFVGAFRGFFVSRGHALAPSPARTRQIEFVGDSSMSGYGDRSTKIVCTPEEVRLRTDTQRAYPALLAKRLHADYQINAISGRGLIRNYGGFAPGQAMSQLYPRLLPSAEAPYEEPTWRPQIFVVKLNADFAGGPPKQGEPWGDINALATDYIQAYGRFVALLHARSPEASILIWWFDLVPNMGPGDRAFIEGGRAAIADAAHRAGVEHIDFLPMSPLLGVNDACDHHGSLQDHARTADWLVRYLQAHQEYWRGH